MGSEITEGSGRENFGEATWTGAELGRLLHAFGDWDFEVDNEVDM